MVDITTLQEDELNNYFRVAHNEKEFCELCLAVGLETYNGDDMKEQIEKAEHVMSVISAELKRRLTGRATDMPQASRVRALQKRVKELEAQLQVAEQSAQVDGVYCTCDDMFYSDGSVCKTCGNPYP